MPLDDDYLALLGQARRRGFAVGHSTLEAMERAYASSLDDISRILADAEGPLRDHLEGVRRQLRLEWARMEGRVVRAMESGVALQIEEVLGIHREFLASVSRRRGVDFPLVERLGGANPAALSVLLSRGGTANALRSLTHGPMVASFAEVDALLERAVFRGVNAGTFTRDMAALIGGEEIIPHLPSASRLHRGRMGTLDPRRYGISEADFPAMRNLLFRSRMISVSETNNALREANRQALSRSGLIEAVHFQTSGIHDGLFSSPDECDVLADTDAYGLGPGMYPPRAFPDGPHPHCGCTQGRVRARRPSQWEDPPPGIPGPPKSPSGVVDEMFPHVSDKARASILQSTNRAINSGFRKPLRVPGSFATATGAVPLAAAASAVRPPRGGGAKRAGPPDWDLASNPDIPTDRNVFSTPPSEALKDALEAWAGGQGTPETVQEILGAIAGALNVRTKKLDLSPGARQSMVGGGYATNPGVQQVILRSILRDDSPTANGWYNRLDIGLHQETLEKIERVMDAIGRAATTGKPLSEFLDPADNKGLHTLIHELHHALSPGQNTTFGRRKSWDTALEEGLVEILSRRAVVQATGVHHGSTSYTDYVEMLEYWATRFGGDELLERLWNKTPRERAAVIQEIAKEHADHLTARLTDAGAPDLPTVRITHKRAVDFGHWIMDDLERAVEFLEEAAPRARAGTLTDHDKRGIRQVGRVVEGFLLRLGAKQSEALSYRAQIAEAFDLED